MKRLPRRAKPLTHEKLLDRAMNIIGGNARRDLVESAMRFRFVQRLKTYKQCGRYGVFTQGQVDAAADLELALHKLELALKKIKETGLDHWLPNLPDQIDVERWWKDAKEAAKTKIGPQSPTRPEKYHAAEVAARLLKKHGIPLSFGRAGKFCKLAAVIYGDPEEEFLHHCRAIGANRNRAKETGG